MSDEYLKLSVTVRNRNCMETVLRENMARYQSLPMLINSGMIVVDAPNFILLQITHHTSWTVAQHEGTFSDLEHHIFITSTLNKLDTILVELVAARDEC